MASSGDTDDAATTSPTKAFLIAPTTFASPLPAVVWNASFDVSVYSRDRLHELACALFAEADCMTSSEDDGASYSIPTASLAHFLARVARHHHAASIYHGWSHGVHVLLNVFRLSRGALTTHYTRFERLALLLAAICHDLQHCGMGNAWCAAAGYWCNADHATKGYTRNLLERNSVDRTIELLTGKPFHEPLPLPLACSTPEVVAVTVASAAASASSSPSADSLRDYLTEWQLSPALQTRLLGRLEEYILGTDIGDLERHTGLTGDFAKLVGFIAPPAVDDPTNVADTIVEETESERELEEVKAMEADSTYSSAPATNGAAAPSKKRRSSASATHSRAKSQKLDLDPCASLASSPSLAPTSDFTFSSPAHRHSLARVLLLCGDIGCVGEVFPLALSWADRLFEEAQLGQSFVVTQAARVDKADPTWAQNEAMRSLPRPCGRSRYSVENDDVSNASTSLVIAATPVAALPSPSSPALLDLPSSPPLASMSVYYSQQLHFYCSYALPLYRPLHASGLLPALSHRFFPQLERNVAYLRLTAAQKPPGEKARLYRSLTKGVLGPEDEATIQQLHAEYDAVQAFHTSLNAQQTNTRIPVQLMVFEDATPPPD